MDRTKTLKDWMRRAFAGEDVIPTPAIGWVRMTILTLIVGAFLVQFVAALMHGEPPYPGAE
jgi:hypothetical protein